METHYQRTLTGKLYQEESEVVCVSGILSRTESMWGIREGWRKIDQGINA